jgi:hypothetical protein
MTRQEWAAEALRRAAEHVEKAAKGARHDELKRRACSVAPYVRDGAIGAEAVTSRLVAAAAASGKSSDEARSVVAWALDRAADGDAWYPDPDDQDAATIEWGGRTLQLPRRTRKDRPPLELVGEDYEPTPIRPRLQDLDLSGVRLPTCPAPPPEDCPLEVTMYPPMKGGTQGARIAWTWGQLVREVADPHLDAADKARDVPMWAPHTVEGDKRARGAVPERHTALILDYDAPGWSLDAARADWGDVRHVVHTSWSHQVPKDGAPACPRGRVVVALSRPVTPDEHAALAEWVLQSGRGTPGAPELRSVIRAYVAPCEAPGGYEHASHDPGQVVDVDALLAALERLRDGVAEELEQHGPDPDVWGMLDVRRNKDGEVVAVLPHHRNLVTILRHDRRQAGRFTYDAFLETGSIDGKPVGDVDVLRLMEWVGDVYGLHPPKDRTVDAVRQVCHETTTHVLQDYLHGLVWDGVPRVQDLLWRYMGCHNAPDGLSQVYARRWMVSAVARALRPGCKVDTMLILKGPQGARKSTGFRVLGGDWFSDSPIPIGTDDAAQALQGVWIQELPELDSLRRKEVTAIKAFIAAQEDHFRRRFDRFWTDRPRQSVLVGTTNEDSFLADATGSRRFWVREVVRRVDIEAIERDRDQLWAEAVMMFEAGDQWWLTDAEDAQRVEDNEAYQVEYPWQADLLERGPALGWFELADVLGHILDQRPGDVQMRDLQSAGRVLSAAGYQKKKSTVAGRRAWRWHAP